MTTNPFYTTNGRISFEDWQKIKYGQKEDTVQPAEEVNPVVRGINHYVRKAKYNMANGIPLGGEYALPAIGLTALTGGAFAAAPVVSAAAVAGGTVGGKAVDFGTKFVTGKTWADKVHDWTGLDKEPAEMTNPGMWVGANFWANGANTVQRAIA